MTPLLACLLLVAPAAAAQGAAPDCPEQDATVCGRHHFEAGTAAFEKNDFTQAAREFQAALAQRPHPVIRFNLAISLARLGKPTAAIEQIALVVADNEADKDLKSRAERERRDAESALSRVKVKLSDPQREQVELDGKAASVANGEELLLDPGTHHVRIISGNSIVLDQEVELAPGERVELRVGERSRSIDVVVVPDHPPAEAKAAPPSSPSATPSVAVAPVHSRRPLSPAWFVAGAGATAVLTGFTIWSGVNTLNAYSDYKRDLPALSTQEREARVQDGHSRELRTDFLLAGSVLCAAGTAALGVWFVDFSGGGRASVGVAPGALALSGKF